MITLLITTIKAWQAARQEGGGKQLGNMTVEDMEQEEANDK